MSNPQGEGHGVVVSAPTWRPPSHPQLRVPRDGCPDSMCSTGRHVAIHGGKNYLHLIAMSDFGRPATRSVSIDAVGNNS